MTLHDIARRFWRRAGSNREQSHPVRVEALVVEDNEDELFFISALLKQQGVVVTQARSISGTLRALASKTLFQLAFVDLGLPNGSGLEVVRRISESRRMCHVIIVSGELEQVKSASFFGYVGILSKPYTVNSIGRILWLHRLPCAL